MSLKQKWEIKYRPTNLDNFIFQDENNKNIFLGYIKDKSIPNLFFAGHRGIGKTTLAMILKNELGIEDVDFLKLNASDDNSVDVIRTKIKNFVTTFAMGPFKIVFLDEADYLTPNAQAILRAMMQDEEITSNARFILACNYPKKVIPELRSRCHEFTFNTLSKDEMLMRLATILKNEKIKIGNIELLDKYVDIAYPDMRKLIILAEQNTMDGKLLEPVNLDTSIEYKLEILDALAEGDWEKIRTIVCDNVDGDDWVEVYRFLYEYLNETGKFKTDTKKWKMGIVTIAEYLHRHSSIADPEINFTACILRLIEI